MDILARTRLLVGTTNEWAADDLVIGEGELVVERASAGVLRAKVGNGAARFSQLPYLQAGSTATPPLIYRGTVNVTAPAPAAVRGDAWINNTAGLAHASWAGLAGLPVALFDLVAFDGAIWQIAGSAMGTDATLRADLAHPSDLGRGDALIGVGAVTTIVAGVLTRFSSIASAIAALGAGGGEVRVRGATAIAANLTVPAGVTLRMLNRAQVTLGAGFVVTMLGRFECDPVRAFTGPGTVVLARGSVQMVRPQWWGARGDAAVDGSAGTDSTAAFIAAIAASSEDGAMAVAILPIRTGPGNFMVGNLVFPPASDLRGEGRHVSNFIAKPGTVGKWFTDTGNAAKIILSEAAQYAHGEPGITHGLQLGRGATPHGTEGYIKNWWIRDCSAPGASGMDVLSNVGWYDMITVQNCSRCLVQGGVIAGFSNIAIMQPLELGAEFAFANVDQLHIEAPANGCLPLRLLRDASIGRCSISLGNNVTLSHLMELDPATTTWSMEGFEVIFNTLPATVTVTNGNFKRADGTYFGGNASGGSKLGNGSYSSEEAGQKLQSFALRITNTAGTLQHRISTSSANLSNFAGKISGATFVLTNTPNGADAATAMVAGGKISSASPSIFYFDTPAQKDQDSLLVAGSVFSTAGTALSAIASLGPANINGVNRTRLLVQFVNAATGANFDLTVANIAAGKLIQVPILCYLT